MCSKTFEEKIKSLSSGACLRHLKDLNFLLENGKPINDSKGEINYASWFTEWFSEQAKRAYGKTIPSTSRAANFS